MAFIPKESKWYLAWLVEEITVEDDPRNVVHTNLMLVRADSPGEAYEVRLNLENKQRCLTKTPTANRLCAPSAGFET